MSDGSSSGSAPPPEVVTQDRLAAPKWLGLFRKVNNFQWIMGEVEGTRQLIKRLAAQTQQAGSLPWRETAEELLQATEQSVKSRERQRAWLTLKSAQRACIYGMTEAEIGARAIELHNEAEKIDTPWRVKAIQEILNLGDKAPSNADLKRLFNPDLIADADELQRIWKECAKIWRDGPDCKPIGAAALAVATAINDEHFDNLWRKVERRQNAIVTSMVSLAAVTALIVGFWKFWSCMDLFNVDIISKDGAGQESVRQISLLVVALFGALGASLSTAYTLVSADLPNKYTEGAMTIAVTAIRPLIGAAAAVAILFIYAGGLMEGVLATDVIKPNVIFAVAFTSGFSERLIFSATNKIAGKAGK